jgi:hypothetical protein
VPKEHTQMTIETIVTLIIAVYGALLSTILGVREFNKEKRKVAIFLEHKEWTDTYSIILTNSGHRPVTLVDISMWLPDDYGDVPRGIIREVEDPFPFTLDDGQHLELKLSHLLGSKITPFYITRNYNMKITLYDAENIKYSKFTMLSHNEKLGDHTPLPKRRRR